MINTGNAVKHIEAMHFDASSLTANYQIMNELGFEDACFLMRMHNASSTNIMISFDGINDHEYLSNGSSLQLPAQSNAEPQGFVSKFAKGTKIYIKAALGFKIPISGTVYLIGYS